MKKITDALKSGKILVSDGAWGTALAAQGLQPGECPELWSLDHFEIVRGIAQQYLDAGADLVGTNSFGANRLKLENFGLQNRCSEINLRAAQASREAANGRWVLGSIGPTGRMLLLGDTTPEELYDAFREQAQALEKGGADAVCIETMSDLEEAGIAIRAAKENTGLEVICTFTFEKTKKGEYRTMMGVTPAMAAEQLHAAGADIIGTNCGNGMERMADIVREMKEVCPDAWILVHANAGLPQNLDGVDYYPETPEEMGRLTEAVLRAGANIVGGCCGTTPAHIRAIRHAVDRYTGKEANA